MKMGSAIRMPAVSRPCAVRTLNFAIDAEAVANDAREAVENFREISAGFFLDEQRGDEKAHVDRRDALGHVQQGVAQR